MINRTYQLVNPRQFLIKYSSLNMDNKVIVRPRYLAICHADQRYYLGKRDAKVLKKKLPMALIHEACGVVVNDPTKTFQKGQKVVMIPNVPGMGRSDEIFENYQEGSRFLSSGYDGFMREFVDLDIDRVVPFNNISWKVAAITEFVSVGVHAVNRFKENSHKTKNTIGIWGDGSLAYVVACILSKLLSNSDIVVIGKDKNKLSNFSFVKRTYIKDFLPDNFCVDHAFECAGGEGSYFAIDDIIKYIKPQGTVMLMGVSENKVPINTRNILEKGLTFIGCSRSGRNDFEIAVDLIENEGLDERFGNIIFKDDPVYSIEDIHRVFAKDLTSPFKTVFEWNL